jgi:hypothetical protein
LSGELHQIHAYVEATTARIQYLEEILEPSATGQLVEIKRGLKDAHRRLEKLGERYPVVVEITKEVWQTYRRLRHLEERLRFHGRDSSMEEKRKVEPRVVHVPPAEQTSSVGGGTEEYYDGEEYLPTETASDDFGDALEVSHTRQAYQTVIESELDGELDSASYFMSGGLLVEREEILSEQVVEQRGAEDDEYLSAIEYLVEERESIQRSSVDEDYHDSIKVISPVAIAVAIPTAGDTVTDGHYQPIKFEDSRTTKYDAQVKPKTVHFPNCLTKSRREVVDNVEEEERHVEAALIDPHRKRQGSADGWLVSLAIMTGNSDLRMCVPHLMCIKIHEVRALKRWLCSMGYLRQSHGLSRTEKVLHLLTLMQMGSRYESVAVLFSRTPAQVANSCSEVFEGLLQLHSETMLPGRIMSKYLYPHLWHIVYNYSTRRDPTTDERYYPMEPEDVYRVLVTVNIYIGRYRSQGQFSLVGPIMDWGRYIEAPHAYK